MSQYDNNLTGVLFKHDKQGNEKRPDYKGSAEIEGLQYWVSAWIRDTAKGKCLSMKYERKEQQAAPTPAAQPASSIQNDDLPF